MCDILCIGDTTIFLEQYGSMYWYIQEYFIGYMHHEDEAEVFPIYCYQRTKNLALNRLLTCIFGN